MQYTQLDEVHSSPNLLSVLFLLPLDSLNGNPFPVQNFEMNSALMTLRIHMAGAGISYSQKAQPVQPCKVSAAS
jgi:hypothetical protein